MLILDVKTRWNSTFEMIQRAIKMREVVDILTSCDVEMRQYALDADDWKVLRDVLDFLQVRFFNNAPLDLSNETFD